MRKSNFLIVFLLVAGTAFGQGFESRKIVQERYRKFMVGVAFDAVKTDFKERVGNKLQGGLEVNWFVEKNYSVTIGGEVWTGEELVISGVAGLRFYPLKNLFIRARGLLGANDISAGAGFQKVISEQWSAEGMIDYYLDGQVAARVGLAFLLVKQPKPQH